MLIEVLVSVLVISLFIAVTMQAFLIAIAFKARGDQRDEAINWIQEDLEFVKHQASEYEKNVYPYSAKCNTTVADNGFAAGLLNSIGISPINPGPRILGGKAFILSRNAVYDDFAYAYKLLQLTYTVTPEKGGSAIATLSTEVMPDAALKCP